MKKCTLSLLIVLIGLFSTTFGQKTGQNENSLLWEISGNGLSKPSYLFGTFHLMCKNQFENPEKLTKAMNETKQIVLEINLSDPSQMAEMGKMMLAEERLTEIYTAKEQERFRKGIAAYGMKMEDLDQFSPMAIYSTLMMKFMDCPPTEMKMIDLEIMQEALIQGKKLQGLETVSLQADFFKNYLTPKDLLQLVENYELYKKQTNEMLDLYLKEDLTALSEMMLNETVMTQKQRETLLDQRNVKWIEKIPEIMEDQSTLFAVGAGHLLGKKGIITLLRNKGYKVTAIK